MHYAPVDELLEANPSGELGVLEPYMFWYGGAAEALFRTKKP